MYRRSRAAGGNPSEQVATPDDAAAPPDAAATEEASFLRSSEQGDFVTRLSNESTHVISPSQAELLNSTSTIKDAYARIPELMVPCLAGKGLEDIQATRGNDGSWQFRWAGRALNQPLVPGVVDPYAECYWSQMDDIDRLWQQSPEVESAAVARGLDVLECVRGKVPTIEFNRDTIDTLNAQMFDLDQKTGVVTECIHEVAGGSTQVKFTGGIPE